MESVKGQYADECDMQVYAVNDREPEPEPESEPQIDGDGDDGSDPEHTMCKDDPDFRHIKEEMQNKKRVQILERIRSVVKKSANIKMPMMPVPKLVKRAVSMRPQKNSNSL